MAQSLRRSSMNRMLSRWNIAVGQFFFRHRNAIFPLAIGVIVLCVRPRILWGSPAMDRAAVWAGVAVVLLGETIRLLTIGLRYIERGGRAGKVYASRLVMEGMYAHTRNPMYVGNFLIVIGICMISGAPGSYVVVIPTFAFIYQAIIAAEEEYIRGRFGARYEAYCRRVPRFLLRWRGLRRTFARVPFGWQRALRQDLSTITGLLVGMTLLPLWRLCFLEGAEAVWRSVPWTLAQVSGILALYAVMSQLKRRGLLVGARERFLQARRARRQAPIAAS